MRTYGNVSYGEHPEQLMDLYLPDCKEFPIYIHFHGGGLEGGEKGDVNNPFVEATYLTEKGIGIVSVGYRLYPNAVYPDFIRDCAAAVAWVKNNIESYGRCTKLFVGGSSAGGYISMMLCFDKKWLAPYGISPEIIDGFIHDAGQPTVHFNVLRERGIDSRRIIIDESAPLYHIGISEKYPPMKFIVSDNDMPGRYEQTMLVIAALKGFGYDMSKIEYVVMHGTHTSYGGTCDENGVSIYGRLIGDFIEKYML